MQRALQQKDKTLTGIREVNSLAKQKLMGEKIGKKSAHPSGVSDQEKPGTEKSHLGAAL